MNIRREKIKTIGFMLLIISFMALSLLLINKKVSMLTEVIAIVLLFSINYSYRDREYIREYRYMNLYIILNILLIYFVTFQARELGFDNGILKGEINGISYYDAATYYDNIISINNYSLKDFFIIFLENIKSGNKLYNIFTYYNLLVCKIFGNGIVTLLLVKFSFTVISLHTIIKIAKTINIKNTNIPMIIFSVYPGLLLANVSLLRDNIILFFLTIAILNAILYKKYNNKKSLLWILISCVFLAMMRIYVIGALVIAFFLVSKFNNLSKLLKKIFLFFLVLLCINFISIKLGYGVMGLKYINKYMNQMGILSGIIQTFIRIIIGYKMVFSSLSGGIICNVFVVLSPIYIIIINFVFLMKIILKKIHIDKRISLFYFSFAFINGLFMVLRDGIIIERIYIMWLWIPCFYIFKVKRNKLGIR